MHFHLFALFSTFASNSARYIYQLVNALHLLSPFNALAAAMLPARIHHVPHSPLQVGADRGASASGEGNGGEGVRDDNV